MVSSKPERGICKEHGVFVVVCCLHFWSRCFCWHLLFALLLLLLVVVVLVFLLVFVVCTSVGGGAGGEMVVLVERWEHLKTTISDLSPKGFVECWCQKENIYQIFFNLSKKYLLKKRTVYVYNPYTFLGRFLGGFWVPFSLGNDINVSNCNFRREP